MCVWRRQEASDWRLESSFALVREKQFWGREGVWGSWTGVERAVEPRYRTASRNDVPGGGDHVRRSRFRT